MLVIDNRTQESLVTMQECIEVQEDAFRKLAEGIAAHRPRIDVYVPCAQPDSYYRWGSMEGAYNGIYACRVKSDIVSWPSQKTGRDGKVALHSSWYVLWADFSLQHE